MRTALPSAAGPIFCAAMALPAFGQEDANESARAIERHTQEIKESTAPAIVTVTVTTRAQPTPRLAFPGLLIAPYSSEPERIEGTGFFIADRGLLVTTRDLVFDAARIEVRFLDGTVRDATLLGTDVPYRLAVLQTLTPERVAPLHRAPRVEACASTIGWFFGAAGAPGSHTTGSSVDVQVASVRAAPDRGAVYDRFLYAPISLASGGAGGPLVGCDGRLLGMAVGSLVARNGGAASGVRARLPRATLFVRGDDIADAARQIAATGFVERPMIGVMVDGDSNRIETLVPGSPAEAAGLQEGDAIVGLGALAISNYAELTRALLRRRAGDPVKLTLDRAGEIVTKCVTLARFQAPPPPTTAPIPGTVIKASTNAEGDAVFTFVDVDGDCPAAKAGVVPGDTLVAVDGRSAWRFLLRHRTRPAALPPATIEVERDGQVREIALPPE